MAGLCEYRHEGTSQHVRFRVSSETCAVHGMLVIDGQLFPLDEVEDLEVQEESCIGVLVCREEGEPKEGDTAEVLIESAE